MKIVCLSDTHLAERDIEVPECDLFIHSGDIDARSLRDVVNFNNWLKTIKAKHKIFVPGNHDFFFESHFSLCKDTLTEAYLLNNETIKIEGFNIYGSPMTPTFYDWAFMADRGEKIKRYWDIIPDNTDILITHGPPNGILDDVGLRAGHVGCQDLSVAVIRVKPKLHIFGHIHEGYGQFTKYWSEACATHFVNCAIMDKWYDPINKPITVEI